MDGPGMIRHRSDAGLLPATCPQLRVGQLSLPVDNIRGGSPMCDKVDRCSMRAIT